MVTNIMPKPAVRQFDR